MKPCEVHAWCRVCRPEVRAKITATMRTPEARLAASKRTLRYYWGIPEWREYRGRGYVEWVGGHPEAIEAARQRALDWWQDNDEARWAASDRMIELYEDRFTRQMQSGRARRYYALGPGGWRVPGWQRDIYERQQEAYEARAS